MFCSLCSVYAPLSIRLVQNCTSPGWRNIRDVLDLLPGPSFEEIQRVHPSSLRFVLVDRDAHGRGGNYKRQKGYICPVVIGSYQEH